MRKRKALKGGYINGQAASSGPALKEPLYKIDDTKLENIKKTYDELYEKSKQEVELTLAIKKAREQEYNNAQKEELSNFARIEKSTIENKKLAFKALSGFFGFITKFIGSVINFLRQFTAYAIKQLFHGGQGVFLKAFMAIIVIIGVVVGFTYGIDLFNKDTALSSYNNIRQNIINTDYDKYLTMPNSDTYMAKMQERIKSMIPNSYKYKWSSFYNSLSYITTGKNKYDADLTERDEIDIGRCDDIIHINFSESSNIFQKERTYSIIAPKDVILKYNDNLYNDSDYNRIDSNIKELVNKYHSTCIIPIKHNNNTGKYELSLTGNMYLTDDVKITGKSSLIKPIFDNDLKFASFNNILYTGYFDSRSVIGAYGAKLINPNYKGPILRLTTANRDEINTGNENIKGKKTANFYNDYNTLELYTIIDNKKLSYKEFFINNEPSVATIYDQSGNNNHLIYKNYDFIHMPEFKKDNNNQYAIWFNDQHMLVFIKTISYSKIKINTKILFNNITDPANINAMNFLATKNAPVIQISGADNNSLVFTTIKNTDNDNDPNTSRQISDKYKTDVINTNWTQRKNPYTITTKNIYNENKDPIILECLGNAYDVRTENEKNSIDAIQGKNLQNALKQNSFKGYLYELRIFKSDD
jgi:hypothetical protein